MTCIELEQNFKAILEENDLVNDKKNWNIKIYSRLEATHKLSSYKVTLPLYKQESFALRTPFEQWGKEDGSLLWYQSYTNLKHGRIDNFQVATLNNLLDAVCGLLIILSAQFFDGSINPRCGDLRFGYKRFEEEGKAIGGYFNICFPPLEKWNGKIYNFTDIKNLKFASHSELIKSSVWFRFL